MSQTYIVSVKLSQNKNFVMSIGITIAPPPFHFTSMDVGTKSEQSCQDFSITCTCASHLVKSNSLIIFNPIPNKKGQEKEPRLQMFVEGTSAS